MWKVTPNLTWIKFRIVVGNDDKITYANFGDDRLRGLR